MSNINVSQENSRRLEELQHIDPTIAGPELRGP